MFARTIRLNVSELLFEITSFKRSYEATRMRNESNQASRLYNLEHSSLSVSVQVPYSVQDGSTEL